MRASRSLNVMVCVLVALGAMVAALAPTAQARFGRAVPGFIAIDVYIDAGDVPLGAYQFELKSPGARLVGVEGGAHAAFSKAPHYDPAALADGNAPGQGERIIIAAYSTDRQLPVGRTRVARLHLHVEATNLELAHEITLIAAGDAQGNEHKATVEAVRVNPGTKNIEDDNEGDAR